jgi:hypothetical protein
MGDTMSIAVETGKQLAVLVLVALTAAAIIAIWMF